MTPAPQPGDDVLSGDGRRPSTLRIEVPSDFRQLLDRSPSAATAWHDALRTHFMWALGSGYSVAGLHRDPFSARAFYALQAT
jgi:predicted GNAT superfamily acetyltransferase